MKKIQNVFWAFGVTLLFVLLTPNTILAKCNGPNGKTGVCYGQQTCSGTSSPLCCDTPDECTAAATNPTYINCTASSVTQCLASQPIGCKKGGATYCCAASNDCTLLSGTIDSTRSHVFPTKGSTGGDSASKTDLTKCTNGSSGIQTAIGCIRVFDQTTFLSDILKWAVGIGGGIAFLLIIYAGFMIMTGAGNPERLKAGQELLTSALSGLILLVLSIFVLRFIGIDILQLGQFGFGATPTP